MSKEKILLVNAIPLNNGDAALVFSLYDKLVAKGHEVKIATYHYDEVVKLYPNYPFVKELAQHKLFVKLPFLKKWLLPLLFSFSKPHKEADVIIGVPGGYVNSNYNIKSSLQVFKIARKKHKKTGIYAQSVGPLRKDDAAYFRNLMEHSLDFLMLRDTYSYNLVKGLDVVSDKYMLTKDAAFLLQPKDKKKSAFNKVAISVREWQYDDRDRQQYIDLIKSLTKVVIDKGYKVEFLSTCQGLSSYKNDAILANEILKSLPAEYQNKADVLNEFYDFYSFYNKLQEYDFVIGTRLHMCILALTQNIPAFNISYEIKGKETYKYLEIREYSVDYNDDIEDSIQKLQTFIQELSKTSVYLQHKIPKIRKEVEVDFESFYKKLFS